MASIKRLTITSEWPLPTEGIRFVTPKFLLAQLSAHPISSDLYPLATGYYPNADGHSIKRLEHDSHLFVYCSAGKGSCGIAYLIETCRCWPRCDAGDSSNQNTSADCTSSITSARTAPPASADAASSGSPDTT